MVTSKELERLNALRRRKVRDDDERKRAEKAMKDFLWRSPSGAYRKDRLGNKIYDTGDVISKDGDRIIKRGNSADAFFEEFEKEKAKRDSQFELDELDAERRRVWQEEAQQIIDEDRNKRGVGSERDNVRRMLLGDNPMPHQYTKRPLQAGERYNPSTDMMITDASGKQVILRTQINDAYKQYKDMENALLRSKQIMDSAKKIGVGIGEVLGGGSRNSGGRQMTEGEKALYNKQRKTINEQFEASDKSPQAQQQYVNALNKLEQDKNQLIGAGAPQQQSPIESMLRSQVEPRPTQPGDINIEFLDKDAPAQNTPTSPVNIEFDEFMRGYQQEPQQQQQQEAQQQEAEQQEAQRIEAEKRAEAEQIMEEAERRRQEEEERRRLEEEERKRQELNTETNFVLG